MVEHHAKRLLLSSRLRAGEEELEVEGGERLLSFFPSNPICNLFGTMAATPKISPEGPRGWTCLCGDTTVRGSE